MKFLTSGLIERGRLKRPLKYYKFHQNVTKEDSEPFFKNPISKTGGEWMWCAKCKEPALVEVVKG